MTVRSITTVMVLLAWCAPAQAMITCEQLINIAYSTEQERNRGASLRDLIADADRLQPQYGLTASELEEVKGVISTVYSGARDWKDVMKYCKPAPAGR